MPAQGPGADGTDRPALRITQRRALPGSPDEAHPLPDRGEPPALNPRLCAGRGSEGARGRVRRGPEAGKGRREAGRSEVKGGEERGGEERGRSGSGPAVCQSNATPPRPARGPARSRRDTPLAGPCASGMPGSTFSER